MTEKIRKNPLCILVAVSLFLICGCGRETASGQRPATESTKLSIHPLNAAPDLGLNVVKSVYHTNTNILEVTVDESSKKTLVGWLDKHEGAEAEIAFGDLKIGRLRVLDCRSGVLNVPIAETVGASLPKHVERREGVKRENRNGSLLESLESKLEPNKEKLESSPPDLDTR